MPWTMTILSVDTRYDSATMQVQIDCDDPPLSFQKQYDFRQAEDMTQDALVQLVNNEVQRMGDLYMQAANMQTLVGQPLPIDFTQSEAVQAVNLTAIRSVAKGGLVKD